MEVDKRVSAIWGRWGLRMVRVSAGIREGRCMGIRGYPRVSEGIRTVGRRGGVLKTLFFHTGRFAEQTII